MRRTTHRHFSGTLGSFVREWWHTDTRARLGNRTAPSENVKPRILEFWYSCPRVSNRLWLSVRARRRRVSLTVNIFTERQYVIYRNWHIGDMETAFTEHFDFVIPNNYWLDARDIIHTETQRCISTAYLHKRDCARHSGLYLSSVKIAHDVVLESNAHH